MSNPNPIRILIVDDESEAREGIKVLLERDPEVMVAADCKNGLEAIAAVHQERPDLLLLDIQMPEVNGFEVLGSLAPEIRPAVIFITAFDQYALKAFEVHAIDYLLKPFTDSRFFESINRAKEMIRSQSARVENQQVNALIQSYTQTQENLTGQLVGQTLAGLAGRLIIKSGGKIHFLELDQIIWIEAYDYYIRIHLEGQFFLVRETMKRMEEQLPDQLFIRIHKSSIVNLKYIRDLEPYFHGDYMVNLRNDTQLKLSKSYRAKLLGHLSGKRDT